MAAIKIVLQKVKRANGTYPIRIRVTKNRKSKFFKTIFQALPEEFDEKAEQFTRKYANYIQSNRVLLKFKDKALKVYTELEYENEDFSLIDFERAFISSTKPAQNIDNFFYFWNDLIEDLNAAGRTGDARIHKHSFAALKKFNGSTQLRFEQIDITFLQKYENQLRSQGGTNGGISVRMRSIRTVYNLAISRSDAKTKIGRMLNENYPFKKYKISRLKSNPIKKALQYEEMMKIVKMDITKYPHLILSHNLFVFSFYTRGMNFTDQMLLEWGQISSNKINYTRSKTKGVFNITILPPVRKILDYYKENCLNTKYVFPILLKDNMTPMQIENRKHKTRKQYNKDLKEIAFHCEIDTNLTSYVARHTFANSLKQLGVATDVISEALGHETLAVTQTYLKDLDSSVIDEASALLL
ncbi:site-specific integrase [Ulvibacterium marinum]|uniref:Site-specific integrase n=1 Tax=Ulvibacterium marinum TaxID=2419782 RepID=A0A3B0CGW8_9FLAO|nr:site-specific integrase [Ulvibacterium marinum]RKN83437.1 site-specific integrase [Ulvibacterium marinum]